MRTPLGSVSVGGMLAGWLVVRTQHSREVWAAENIRRQEGEPYLPRVAERIKRGALIEVRSKYLFPSYIFVKYVAGRWRFLLGTYGVNSVIMGTGNNPAVVADTEVAKLRACEDVDGLIRLPEWLPGEGVGEGRFRAGEAVRVNGGLYKGYEGLYVGQSAKDREKILLEYLGRKTSVLIDTDQLSKT